MATEPREDLDVQSLIRQLILARNAAGVRRLAEEAGLSHDELAALLREELAAQMARGGEDRLGQRYDIATGQYSTLEQWGERVLAG